MKSLALFLALCAALILGGCVTETEDDDSVVYNRISTTKRVRAKKRPRPNSGGTSVRTEYLDPSDL